MKSVKQVVAVLMWCVVSVGCVAEEAKQSAAPAEAVSMEQATPVDDGSEMSLTTDVDSKLGEEYQEIRESIVVKKIEYKRRSSNTSEIRINDEIAITYYYTGPAGVSGSVIFPKDWSGNWNQLIGMKADIFCRSYILDKKTKKILPCSILLDASYYVMFH